MYVSQAMYNVKIKDIAGSKSFQILEDIFSNQPEWRKAFEACIADIAELWWLPNLGDNQ